MITQSSSSALPIAAWRETGEDGENTCWEPSVCFSQEARDESPSDPGVRGHPAGEPPSCSVHSQLIPGECLSLKDFFIPLAEKKITTELTSPVKIHDSGKSLRIK